MAPRKEVAAGEEDVKRRLQEAIDRLQEDVRRVEIWAGALSGFLQPIPDYEAGPRRHELPRHDERSVNALRRLADPSLLKRA